MRTLLTLAALALTATAVDAQVLGRGRTTYSYPSCPGGVCPAPQQFGAPLTSPLTAPIGSPPSSAHEWGVIPGYGYGWKLKTMESPKTMEAAPNVPAPKFAMEPSTGRDAHGRLFYRVVKDRAYGQLVDRGVPKDKARKLVDTLSHESIDVYAQHVGISQGIGDGKLIDWLIDHRTEILALIKLIVSLLAVL